MEKILVVDDELNARRLLKEILEEEGYQVFLSEDGKSALEMATRSEPDLVILDLVLPGIDGLEVLKELRAARPGLEVVMISGYGTIDSAVKAIKLGAYDFLEKPLDSEKVRLTVKNTLKKIKLERELETLKSDIFKRYRMVGSSPPMRRVHSLIEKAAETRASVLILGESGVGKELAARAIHLKSERRQRPFVALNCAALPETLIESELFGYEKGAFTGAHRQKRGKLEIANGGTLFLDEVGDMSLATQAKLLRFLELGEFERLGGEGELIRVDTRVIAASNKDLKEEIKHKRFRDDLFHRLCVVCIHIPPLRDRREDIPELIDHFLDHFAAEYGRPRKELSREARAFLTAQGWPGNVRELKNLIARIATLSRDLVVSKDEVSQLFAMGAPLIEESGLNPLKAAQAKFERDYILSVLKATDFKLGKAARILGIDRANLYRKLKKFKIEKDNR